MSSGAIKIHRAWLCLSQTIVLFSPMNFTAFCSIGEAIWGICGVWDFLLPYYMAPGYTFKIVLPVLYLVHMIQNVFLYKMGELSVSGVVTSCQSSTLLLTCFLSLLLFTSCSLMETSRAEWKFSWRSQGTKYDLCVRYALLLRRGAWAFGTLFSGGSKPPAFFPTSPWVQRCSEVDVTGSLIPISWLLLYMKTQDLWQLSSNQ